MRKVAPLVLIVSLLIAALACSLGSNAPNSDIVGKYDLEGTNPDGTGYSGTVEIVNAGDGYDLTWTIDSGPQAQIETGHGTLDGQTLTALWQMADNSSSGTEQFTINSDGTLDGTWKIEGSEDEGQEVLTRQ